MNRFASAVMVAGAGMVGLGMTATLAGAQTHPATYPPNDVMQAPFASDMLPAPCAWFCGAHRPDHAIEDYPQIGADGALFALQGDGNQPLHPVVLSATGQWRRLAPEALPSSFPSATLVMPQAVTFMAKDGQETHAQLFLPQETTSKPHPAILFFHGGPQRQMLLGFNTNRTYS